MSRLHAFIALSLAVLVNCGSLENKTSAATRLTNDLAELLGMAGLVVEATVQATSVQTDTRNGIPLTLAVLKVHRVYKGDVAPESEITVESFGGFNGTQTVIACGQPQFNAGDRSLLLLAKSSANPMNWRVLGGDIGQIILSEDKDGQTVARRAIG
ncbi:MAG: hypothetical protein NTW87_02005 [Planctomycetota bacterium]|nr:hypothetical protein [Planctomycetota bacterium]